MDPKIIFIPLGILIALIFICALVVCYRFLTGRSRIVIKRSDGVSTTITTSL
jgi:hypothetical protein